ncbi:MAG: RagB/SusD family nutrient uptake outer membrane protein, partial [Saprospiraceae bacterium]
MKRFAIIKFMVVGLLLATFNQSCTDLEEELFSQVAVDDFFKTDEEFISALGSAYTSLYFYMNHGNYMSIQEISSDEMMIPQRGADWFDGGIWLRTHRHEFASNDDQYNGAWNVLYGGVSTCNRLIFQFEQLGTPEADGFIAELKVLRGLYYWWLLDSFGNIPLVDKFDVPEGFIPEQSNRQTVFDFIEKELNDNVSKLSQAVDGTTYARMNYYVGKALQAKLYLNAEVYTGTARWADAVAAADEVLNSGQYSLEANYFANFNTNNAASKENIFVVPYDQVFAGGFNLAQMTLHYGSQATFNLQDQPWNGYCSFQGVYNSYEDTDARKGVSGNTSIRGNFHVGPQLASDGSVIEDASALDPDGTPLNFTPEINEHFPNTYRQAGARVGKYEFAIGATPNL